MALALALVLLCLAATPGHADCGRGPGAMLPTLPVLMPAADGMMTLAIKAERSAAPIAIGDLMVADVPIFSVQPMAGTRLRAVDALGRLGADLPVHCLTAPEALYAGSIWALRQGDQLHVRLISTLDFHSGDLPPPPAGGMSCQGINLHTHGLLVSPARRTAPDGSQSLGDQAFDIAVPPADGGSGSDPCDRNAPMAGMTMDAAALHHAVPGALNYVIAIPGTPGESGRGDGQHPSGLFWFHPHTHGYSAALTAGGTTGLITIGDLADYLCIETTAGCAAPRNLPVRMLVLKDAEILPDRGGWRLAHERVYPLEDACTQSAGRDEERRGECNDYRGRRWLFTVNGARYPLIGGAVPGRAEVWRIVNASPNMSYRLRLRPEDGGPSAAPLPFRILTLEGAAPSPDRMVAPQTVNDLLLMPASRAEIVVVPPASGGSFVLEQQAFTTGGDSWPRALLAELRVPAAGSPAPATDAIRLRAASPSAPLPQHFYDHTAEPACDYPSGSVRHILLVARPTFSDDRRRPTKFGLIASLEQPGHMLEVIDADGHPQSMTRELWITMLAKDADAPAFMHNPLGSICTYVGHSETWIIENYTAEAHNFHIHQTEFRVAEAHRGDPAFFSAAPTNGLGALQRSSDAAIATADSHDRAEDGSLLYRDTVPVPRGESAGGRGCDGSPLNDHCRPGRITLTVRFDRDAQVGTFVYHCHILQHEDGGMMAIMRVLCPPGDASCAARHPADQLSSDAPAP
jgi:FtsP/CotA-like multicopper oxidase with cupredoxin domain